jgi:hypothetical protein
MVEAWIDTNGKVHEAKSGESHADVARRLFPSAEDPEIACEKARYIKTGTNWSGSPMMENAPPKEDMPQAQLNAVEQVWSEHYSSR